MNTQGIDSKLIDALSCASSLELFQLSTLIERLLADPRRIIAVRKDMNLGQTVRFVDWRDGSLREGKVVAMRDTQVTLQDLRERTEAKRAEVAKLQEELDRDDESAVLPSRTHSIVLVSGLNLATRRAVRYARATRPDMLEAITVNVDDRSTRTLVSLWEASEIEIPLKVIASPYREITRPVLDYVRRVRRESPRDVVTVFIPEYVVGHWWEQLLHNQSALRLKGRLLFEPNVMVTSVPWQLNSSERLKTLQPQSAPGDARRGILD